MSSIKLYENDLPADFDVAGDIAIDTETMGLQPNRDRLCVVQLCFGDDKAYLVRFDKDNDYAAPNLRKLLADEKRVKIMHYARFDIAVIYRNLGIMLQPIFCTKIASRLTRTFTDKHGLAHLCRDILGIELNKQQQTSDWGAEALSDKQLSYAASDVLHLHALRDELVLLLQRENRESHAVECFKFLPMRAKLDLQGWDEVDIFSHS